MAHVNVSLFSYSKYRLQNAEKQFWEVNEICSSVNMIINTRYSINILIQAYESFLFCDHGGATFTNRSSYIRERQVEGREGIEGLRRMEKKKSRWEETASSVENQQRSLWRSEINGREEFRDECGDAEEEKEALSVSESLLCTRKRGRKWKTDSYMHTWWY